MSQIRQQQILNFNAGVIASTLTGFTSGAGTVTSSDSILAALQKINGNVAALSTGVTSVFGRTGVVTAQSGDYNTSQVTEVTNLYFTNARAIAAPITGYSSGSGTVAATDSILQAIQKLNGNDALKLPLAGGTLTGFLTLNADPTSALHAATKNYVDNLITGLVWTEVAVMATASLTLSGEQTIDGFTTSGSLVLVTGNTTNNGIWLTQAGAWTRATEADTAAELLKTAVLVKNGTIGANTQWINTNASITLGTTTITFAQMAGAGTYTSGTGISLAGNVFSLNNSYVIGSVLLTGYTSGAGIISSADSILSAIQKLNGNIGALVTGVSSVFGRTGAVVATGGDYNTSQVTESGNLYFTNARAIATPITGYVSGAGVVSATDTILAAIQKLNGNAALLAPIASPTFTGTPAAPTPGSNVNTTQIVTGAWVNTYFIAKANYISREVPTGLVNSSNVTYTLANTPTVGSESVYLNGLLQTITSDYTISGATITFVTAPFTGDALVVTYTK